MTRDEAAEYLGVHPNTLAVWASKNTYDLPYVKVGRAAHYKVSDLNAHIKNRRVAKGKWPASRTPGNAEYSLHSIAAQLEGIAKILKRMTKNDR